MLQLTKFYQSCYDDYSQIPPRDLKEVKIKSQAFFLEVEKRHQSKAKKNIFHYIDRLLWTKASEHIDNPHFDVGLKKEIIHGLHLKNTIFGTYTKTIDLLKPYIEEVNRVEKRPARILELASGMGKLTMALYEKVEATQLQVEMTGSDIVEAYIDEANLEANKKKLNIDFKVIDAFNLDQLEANSYDIIFTLHSMHHFYPEQLSIIMAGTQRIATKAFIGIDGYRGMSNLFFMMVSGGLKSLLSFNSIFFHDSLISGRRMYSAKQLELMARIGCPDSKIEATNLKPGLTMIVISPH